MKRTLEFVVAPSDILTVELDDVVGGGCDKVKNKCKKGTVKVEYQEKLVSMNTITAW
ncbi:MULTISPECIES: hypothetical protein [Culturomica]|uniref:hypothetical protein n=1 Tax=Culturomica TaxID=1926651 RepID=UPI00257AF579|nr:MULTISPECIES: hypothetical protein [Culturomica]